MSGEAKAVEQRMAEVDANLSGRVFVIEMNFLPGGVDDGAGNRVTQLRCGAGGVSEGGKVGFLNKYNVSTVGILFEEVVSCFSGFTDILAKER